MSTLINLNMWKKRIIYSRYFKSIFWLIFEKLFRIVTSVFVSIWVARYLGPSEFGMLQFLLSIALFTATIATLGLDNLIIKNLVNQKGKEDTVLGTAFFLKFIAGFVTAANAILVLFLMGYEHETLILATIIVSGVIFQSFNVLEFFFHTIAAAKYIALAHSIAIVFVSLTKVTMIASGASLDAFVIISAIELSLFVVGLCFFYAFKFKKSVFKWRFDLIIAGSLIQEGTPLLLANIGFALFTTLNPILVNYFLGEAATGVYSSAYRLQSLGLFLPGVIINTLLPRVISAFQTDAYTGIINKVTSLVVWLGIFLALPAFLFSEQIIQIAFGEAYAPAAQIFPLLMLSNVAVFFFSCWHNWKIVEGRSKLVLLSNVLTGFLNALICIILLPKIGLLGAGVAPLLAVCVSFAMLSCFDKSLPRLAVSSMVWKR